MSHFPALNKNIVMVFMVAALITMIAAVFLGGKPEQQPTGQQSEEATGMATFKTTEGKELSLTQEQADKLTAMMAKLGENPEDAETLLALSEIFVELQDWRRAELFLKRTLMYWVSDSRAGYLLGLAYFRQKKIDDATKAFERLINMEDAPYALFNLGIIYKYHKNDPKAGESMFKKVVESPSAPESLKKEAEKELN